jgi:predicted transcriptional regulator of viral defense system
MSLAPRKTDVLLRLARKGPLRALDLEDAGIPRAYLRRFCERGLLEQVDRGLYRLVNAPVTELHSLAEVGKRVPHAVVCLLSALQVHEITTEAPHAVWVLIDRHARMPKLSYPKLEVVRASGPAREHGVEDRIIEGVRVQITTPAKTVVDCFRYRRHVGLDVALESLRDYLAKSRGRPTKRERRSRSVGSGYGYGYGTSRGDGYGDPRVYGIDALVEAARADRVYTILRPYLEALA